MNWNQMSPQMQQYLLAMMMGGQHPAGMPVSGPTSGVMPGAMSGGGQINPASAASMFPAMLGQQPPQLSNPLMAGGNSAVNPQQQAQMMQYLQMLQSPQGFGATANSNPSVWQMLMGRSPTYGNGGAVT